MKIEKGKINQISEIMGVLSQAQEYMVAQGNPNQWEKGYPTAEMIKADLYNGVNYVVVEDGKIIGTFAFILGEDPTYAVIEDGAWHSDAPYGTIHRIASDGTKSGIAKACFDFCLQKTDYLRIDTHADNVPMQNALKRYGFERCGIIYVRNHSPRIAFDFQKGNKYEETF